ncbi:MAG TPA: hypothetical protein VHU82_00740 [Vicinamibacterales bacterium]|nr:hypothetical protein [Vicinamibacterales bacterium]
MKRREFIVRSVGAGAATAFGSVAAFAGSTYDPVQAHAAPSAVGSVPRLSRAWFEKLIDEDFTFHRAEHQPLRARLIGVRAVGGHARHEQFSVTFRVAGGDAEGGLFEAEHAGAGRFPISISPSADRGSTRTCQAHFSLLA